MQTNHVVSIMTSNPAEMIRKLAKAGLDPVKQFASAVNTLQKAMGTNIGRRSWKDVMLDVMALRKEGYTQAQTGYMAGLDYPSRDGSEPTENAVRRRTQRIEKNAFMLLQNALERSDG